MATGLKQSVDQIARNCLAIARGTLKLPAKNVWLDYDEEADVLYLSFRKPQRAKKTIELSEDVLVRKDGRQIVGVTIMNASAQR